MRKNSAKKEKRSQWKTKIAEESWVLGGAATGKKKDGIQAWKEKI